ncbi:hypothetical protein CMI42_06380 [Candidatus Pacearchaeota archaeon]|nr:hypothetical protein [Candidatus Pacearchaeota archaeon]|tara:strand:+ start:12 stop:404 length:393 start_codon:yes stop_codon:yes gene_type:complete
MREKLNNKYFFDTCVLIEIDKGNSKFEDYINDHMIITDLNIMELIFYLLKIEKGEEIEEYVNKFSPFVIEYDHHIIIQAAKMKFKYKSEKLSFTDCIGYLLAKKHNCKFLTSDGKFEDKDNVEFVKSLNL